MTDHAVVAYPSGGDETIEVETTPVGDSTLQVFGDDIVLLLAVNRSGVARAFYPPAECGCTGTAGAVAKPPAIAALESSGWTCWQVAPGTWQCSRIICGRRFVTTINS